MEIVLIKKVPDLGVAGDVVRVKTGYARNFLLPRQLGVAATPANLRLVADIAQREAAKVDKIRVVLEAEAAKLSKISVTQAVRVGEEDQVFGSVTTQQIAEQLAEQGFEVNRKDILLDEPLKALGQYEVPVKLGHGVTAAVTVWVVQE